MAAEPKLTAGDGRHIPLEISTEILSRVPAKSILRFRSVCKSWYSLISCPNFISNHSIKTLNKNGHHHVLLQPYDYDCRGIAFNCPFSSHDTSFMESREHHDVPKAFLATNIGSKVRIVGSCNGLICLCKYDRDDPRVTFLIWNPTIGKVVEVPSGSYSSVRARDFSYYYGFGFDSKTGDYKVMCRRSSLCEIFDLRKGVWRRISLPHLVYPWHVGGRTPECYLHGAVHWSGSDSWFPIPVKILLSFDMSDEVFREMRMPECLWLVRNGDRGKHDGSRVETRSVTYGGLIHVIVWKTMTKRENYVVDMRKECSVWVMKEYGVAESWTKLFNIDLMGAGVSEDIDPSKFRLWENGDVLMVHDFSEDEDDYDYDDDEEYGSDEHMELGDKQGLLLYNAESRKCDKLFSFGMGITDMCLYKESLVLM